MSRAFAPHRPGRGRGRLPAFLLLLCPLLALVGGGALAAEAPWEDGEVRLTVEADAEELAPGEIVTVTIRAKIAPDWHIYDPDDANEFSYPTRFEPAKGFTAIGGLDPDRDPEEHEMEGLGEVTYFEDEVVFEQTLMVDVDAESRKVESVGELHYMTCTMEACLQPTSLPVRVALEVVAPAEDEEVTPDEEEWEDGDVRIDASVTSAAADRGETFTLTLGLEIAPEWHITSPDEPNTTDFFVTRLQLADGLKAVGKMKASHEPKESELWGRYYSGKVILTQEVKVEMHAEAGSIEELGVLHTQSCHDEKGCLLPTPRPIPIGFEITDGVPKGEEEDSSGVIAPGTPQPATPASAGQSKEKDLLDQTREQGILYFIGACALLALIALLTPCVYPMIPITVSYFTKAGHQSRAEAVSHATAYALGIIVTYVGFGVGVRWLLGDQGPTVIAVNGWVNLAVMGVFIVFGLSLLGMFDLALPSSWVDGMNRVAGGRTGYLGDLLMGFTFTLAAFTCTVPVVALILRLGVEGSNFHMFLGMLTYATVFAAPFFVLALVPQAIKSMPKSGGWLNSVKVVLAMIELAAAFKFASAADLYFSSTGEPAFFTYSVVLYSWGIFMLLSALYLLGIFRFEHDTPLEYVSVGRFLAASFFLILGVYLIAGGMGRPISAELASLAPPPPANQGMPIGGGLSGGAGSEDAEQPWKLTPRQNGPEEWEAARALAKETNRPIFLEFSGFT